MLLYFFVVFSIFLVHCFTVFPFMSFCQLHISTFISCFFVHSIFLDRSMYLCPFHVPLSVFTSRIAWYNSQIHVFLSFVFDPRSSLIPSTFSYLSPNSVQRRYWHLSHFLYLKVVFLNYKRPSSYHSWFISQCSVPFLLNAYMILLAWLKITKHVILRYIVLYVCTFFKTALDCHS